MADPHSPPLDPVSSPDIDEAFLADRQSFWSTFTKFSTYAVIAIVVLLVVMRMTLV